MNVSILKILEEQQQPAVGTVHPLYIYFNHNNIFLFLGPFCLIDIFPAVQ